MGLFDHFGDDAEKTVYVRSYLRLRNGKWEDVSSHYRRPPHL